MVDAPLLCCVSHVGGYLKISLSFTLLLLVFLPGSTPTHHCHPQFKFFSQFIKFIYEILSPKYELT